MCFCMILHIINLDYRRLSWDVEKKIQYTDSVSDIRTNFLLKISRFGASMSLKNEEKLVIKEMTEFEVGATFVTEGDWRW